MSKEEEIRAYVNSKVNPVFEKFMVELLLARPSSVVEFTIEWMNTKGRNIETISNPLSSFQATPKGQTQQFEQHQQETIQSSQEEDDDEIEELPQEIVQKKGQKMRTSVSAEAYGAFNKKENFVARKIAKPEEQKERIKKRLLQSFMFQALDKKELEIVIDAMEVKEYKAGSWIIKQGEDGDNLYVVDSGLQDCSKVFTKGGEDKHLKVYQPGESFGELSLLYNVPRAASIKAKTDSILLALDRATFNNIVKDAAIKKRQKYENVLKNIEILSSLDQYELTQICDGIKEEKYEAGEYVIRQGDEGDRFYMIEEGNLIATKQFQPGTDPVKVFEYKSGDYFGELALIRNVPRQANIIAENECSLVYLDSGAFKRLLGPIETILARNADRYEKYIKQNK